MVWLKWFKKIYIKESFQPGIIGLFINPFFLARRGLYKSIKNLSKYLSGGKLLDVGCGSKPYKNLFKVQEYIGLDIDQSGHAHTYEEIDIFYDGKTMPFEKNSIDAILCNQVFEHVFNPTEFLVEIQRILKPDGFLLLSVPFFWDEHEKPYDYARYSSFALKYLLEKNNFEIVKSVKTNAHFGIIFQIINVILYKRLKTKNIYLDILIHIVLLSPFNIFGYLFSIFSTKDKDLYIDNVILAKKRNV